jgi:hypothetical protein
MPEHGAPSAELWDECELDRGAREPSGVTRQSVAPNAKVVDVGYPTSRPRN